MKIEKLKEKKAKNDKKIFELEQKLQGLQKENLKIQKEIQAELDKQILFEIKELNISIEDLKNFIDTKNNNTNINKENNNSLTENNHNNHNNQNINNQERRI